MCFAFALSLSVCHACGCICIALFSEPMGAAGLILQTPKGLSDFSHILSNFKFFGTTVNVSTSRAIALSQCSLPPAMNSNMPRWFTMLSFTSLPAARDVQLGTCPLYLTLEQLFQHSFNLDPLMIVWTGIAGGMNAAQDGIFVPDFGVSLSYVNSHEMSHWTRKYKHLYNICVCMHYYLADCFLSLFQNALAATVAI